MVRVWPEGPSAVREVSLEGWCSETPVWDVHTLAICQCPPDKWVSQTVWLGAGARCSETPVWEVHTHTGNLPVLHLFDKWVSQVAWLGAATLRWE